MSLADLHRSGRRAANAGAVEGFASTGAEVNSGENFRRLRSRAPNIS
jgi:hypothetical protein